MMTMMNAKPKAYSYLRFSTPEQLKGDSFKRQTEAAVSYACENGLDLDNSISYQDLGVSAFRGANVHEGALGAFIQAVDQGKIKAGSFLLVESLDRLSRQDVWNAFTQFSSIINKGITIVTLQDGKTYSAEQGNIGFGDLMVSLAVMQRAHEESLTKSERLSSAWKSKRKDAQSGHHKLTKWCPGWLELAEDRTHYRIIEDRADIVRRIFLETLDGLGQIAIAKRLNDEDVPTFNTRSNGWHETYIRRILTNESTIGVFQPHRKIRQDNGKYKRVPDGDPIEGYFPAVIEPELFYKVQQVRSSRLIPMRNSGKRMANLFTGIAFCGHCGALMHYENKGKTARESKGGFGCGSYLVCSNARRKVRLEDGSLCKAHRWKYPQLQCHIIMNLLEVDFRELYPRMYQSTNENLKRLEGEILRAGGELERTEKALERILDALIDAGKSPTLLAKLNELENRKLKLTQELASLEDQDAQERAQSANIDRDHRAASEALERLLDTEENGTPEEILEARRRLHQLLKKVIDRIVFDPSTAGSVHVNPSLYQGEPQPIHGMIRVYFKLVEASYHREIYVRAGSGKTDPNGQKESWGYKVDDGKEPVLHVAVDDAIWPPEGRLITGPGLWNEVAGIYMK